MSLSVSSERSIGSHFHYCWKADFDEKWITAYAIGSDLIGDFAKNPEHIRVLNHQYLKWVASRRSRVDNRGGLQRCRIGPTALILRSNWVG